ncbi:hypothetical protein Slin15195_G130340 [Septoria linicola]|uniref:Uncharacterized protein n=1 Tax=Septoria linicola TaxID=215465 RepID=A0A9Q9ER25_9PEZI|nr:hypothetical protein Slin15195_G130340 [Septoria linicola]
MAQAGSNPRRKCITNHAGAIIEERRVGGNKSVVGVVILIVVGVDLVEEQYKLCSVSDDRIRKILSQLHEGHMIARDGRIYRLPERKLADIESFVQAYAGGGRSLDGPKTCTFKSRS